MWSPPPIWPRHLPGGGSPPPTLLQPCGPYSILQTRKFLLQGLCTCASLWLKCSSFNILMAHSHSDPSLCSDISLVKPPLFILPKRQSPLLDNIFFFLLYYFSWHLLAYLLFLTCISLPSLPKDISSMSLWYVLCRVYMTYQCLANKHLMSFSYSYFLNEWIITGWGGPFASFTQMGKEKLSYGQLVNLDLNLSLTTSSTNSFHYLTLILDNIPGKQWWVT